MSDPLDNPYAPPLAQVAPAHDGDDPRSVRARHIQHEASLRAFGLLFLLGGGLMVLVGIALLYERATGDLGGPGERMEVAVPLALVTAVAALQLASGVGLRRLAPWSKVPASLAAVVSLVNIPVGTVIGVYGLYLLHTAKGRLVLSADYAAIRAQTPDMRPRTSVVTWVLLGLLVLFAVGMLVGGVSM